MTIELDSPTPGSVNGPLSVGHGEANKFQKFINENGSLFEQSEQTSLKKQINILRRKLYDFAKELLTIPIITTPLH